MKVVTVEVRVDAKSLPVAPSERGSRILCEKKSGNGGSLLPRCIQMIIPTAR